MKEQVLGWLGAAVTSVWGEGLANWQGEEGQWILVVPDGEWQ